MSCKKRKDCGCQCCKDGKDGKDGRDGRDGQDGSPGIPGTPGTNAPSAVGSALNTTLQTVENNADIRFETLGPSGGGIAVANPGAPPLGTTFTVSKTGIYIYTFIVRVEEGLPIFGISVDNATPEFVHQGQSVANVGEVIGNGALSLNAGAVIRLRNRTGSAQTLLDSDDFRVNAELTLSAAFIP
jgi:hypothetical protein